MNSFHLSYEAMMATMSDVVAMAPADLEALGATDLDIKLVAQAVPWQRTQIPRVTRTIMTVCVGVLELHGIPRCTVPAEHLAAVIATLVHPVNRIVACVWLAEEKIASATAMAYGADNPTQMAKITADQLRGLVVLGSHNEKSNTVRKAWANKFKIAIDKEQVQ